MILTVITNTLADISRYFYYFFYFLHLFPFDLKARKHYNVRES